MSFDPLKNDSYEQFLLVNQNKKQLVLFDLWTNYFYELVLFYELKHTEDSATSVVQLWDFIIIIIQTIQRNNTTGVVWLMNKWLLWTNK